MKGLGEGRGCKEPQSAWGRALPQQAGTVLCPSQALLTPVLASCLALFSGDAIG